ncbi:sensor domain-containing diguanylate cyclase [Maritimibacter sp. HL-12]|uniref:GGDEF domain-containing protein n=1 Tax=Maritimibacter sp. HL-12 TaxID=1162418 RepID=UPI000A1CE059|nr:sensor domain-containing diguanylate cyclase [Maritimibacter sp. HL-12]
MTTELHKLSDEAGRMKAFLALDASTYGSEAGFRNITRLLQLMLGMEMVTISLISADKQILRAKQGFDVGEGAREAAICNTAIQSYEPLVIEDTLEDARVRDNPFVTGPPFLRCYIGAPLTTVDGYNLGTICAFESTPRQFNRREIEFVTICAKLVMNELDLRRQANRDPLTKVFNRRSFEAGLNREMERLRRRPGNAVVAFLDIDFFKSVNDTHGHPVGDRVLREFAAVISDQCRENDLVARLGGEEFAVLLPDTDLASARIWAERTRWTVANAWFGGADAVSLTVSVGLTELDATHNTSDAIELAADHALMEAKRLGRNRVVSP